MYFVNQAIHYTEKLFDWNRMYEITKNNLLLYIIQNFILRTKRVMENSTAPANVVIFFLLLSAF
jgi:hypothetical protein